MRTMKSQHTGAVTEEKGEAYFLAPVNSRLAAQQQRCESISDLKIFLSLSGESRMQRKAGTMFIVQYSWE